MKKLINACLIMSCLSLVNCSILKGQKKALAKRACENQYETCKKDAKEEKDIATCAAKKLACLRTAGEL